MSRGGARSAGGSEGQDVTHQRFRLLPHLLVFNTYSSFLSCIYAFIDVCVYFYLRTYFYMTVLESGCIFERDSSSSQKLFFFAVRAPDSLTTLLSMHVRQPCSRQQRIIWAGWSTNLGSYEIKLPKFWAFALKTKQLILSTKKLHSNSGFAHCLVCFCHKGIVRRRLSAETHLAQGTVLHWSGIGPSFDVKHHICYGSRYHFIH